MLTIQLYLTYERWSQKKGEELRKYASVVNIPKKKEQKIVFL